MPYTLPASICRVTTLVGVISESSAVGSDTLAVARLAAKVTVVGKMPVSRLPLSVTVMSTVSGCSNTLPERVNVKFAVAPSVTVPASARTAI